MYTRPKPFIVAGFSSKANVGKTSWIIIMAWYLSAKYNVQVHDADPEHESLTRWLNTIKELPGMPPVPFEWKSAIGESQIEQIPATAEAAKADIVFVDIGGGRSKLATAAAKFADLMVVVTGESVLESITVDDAFDAIALGEKKRTDKLAKAVLLTKTPPNATNIVRTLQDDYLEAQELDNVPEEDRIGVFDYPFPGRKAYMLLGMRHPVEVGIDLSDGTDIKTIEIANMAREIEEAMEMETPSA